jgi:hypothetical protein
MFRDYSWYQPVPRNFTVNKRRQRFWRRWGKHYRKTRAFQLLREIEMQCGRMAAGTTSQSHNIFCLLPFRAKLRRIVAGYKSTGNQGEAHVIHYYMSYCRREMIPVCIWLIGKCRNRFRLYGIPEFRDDPSPQVRKHVAKALFRLEAWSLLDEMARTYPDEVAIQHFATAAVARRPFGERLSHFVETVDDSHAGEVATPSRMPFWALERSWDYTPPKSALLIRRMLRRIRHWVRWGAS